MAKNDEKKVTEVAENEATAMEVDETTETALDLKLFVERKPAKDKFGKFIKTKTGEPIYNYVLPCEIRGRKVNIDFITIDKGGFEVIDLVYFDNDKAEMSIIVTEMTRDGKKSAYTSYVVKSLDENGVELKCNIKPARKSDENLLDMYLNILKHKAA